jgi:hypothetical protein
LEEKGVCLQAEEHHPNRDVWGGCIMLWGCFAAGGTGALHQIDWRHQEGKLYGYIEHLKTSVRKLKLVANGSSKWTITQADFQSCGNVAYGHVMHKVDVLTDLPKL